MARHKHKSVQSAASSKANPHGAGRASTPSNDTLASLADAVKNHPDDITAHHTLATYYLLHKQEEKIISTIEPVRRLIEKAEPQQKAVHQRLAALGYAYRNELLDAETASREGLETDPDGLDYRFVLCFVGLSFREYEKTVELGKAYLDRYAELVDEKTTSTEYTFSDIHCSQVYNFIGSAYFEQDKASDAAEQFRRSIDCDPGNHLPYINLSRLMSRRGDKSGARKIIECGLEQAREVQDLRLLLQSVEKAATISACMIVKDEEELLPGCLDSIRDWVDEIVVVDTGSTDRTIEIAESYGAKVYHQPWEGNFSKHRNYSISLAGCDWIFIIDADERFDRKDVPLLLQTINSGEYQVVSVNVFNTYGKTEHKITSVNSTRFFRRDLNLRYEGIVHNALKIPKGSKIARAPFAIEHLGYDLSPEKMTAKFERSHALLLKQVEADPDFVFAWYNLAQLYRGRVAEDLNLYAPKTIEAAQRVIELVTPGDPDRGHFYVMAHDQIAWMKFLMGRYDEAEDYARRALELKPDYLDPLMLLGHAHAAQRRLPEAIEAYEAYVAAQKDFNANFEIDAYILYHSESQATAYFGMGCVYELMGDRDEAKEYYRSTLDLSPNYLEANLLLGRLALEEGNLTEAEQRFRHQLAGNQPSARAAVGMACVQVQRNEHERAASYFEQALQIDPDDQTSRAKAAEFYHKVGQLERAGELYELRLSSHENDLEALQGLAAIRFSQEDYSAAAELYRRIIDLPGQAERSEILNDLANCLFKQGDYEQAERYYRRATEGEQVPDLTWRNLGLACVRLNRAKQALVALDRYREYEPGDDQILLLIADLNAEIGDYSMAISHYEYILSRFPDSTPALFGLSECYLQMGHQDSAILGYRRILDGQPNFEPALSRLTELGQSPAPVARL